MDCRHIYELILELHERAEQSADALDRYHAISGEVSWDDVTELRGNLNECALRFLNALSPLGIPEQVGWVALAQSVYRVRINWSGLPEGDEWLHRCQDYIHATPRMVDKIRLQWQTCVVEQYHGVEAALLYKLSEGAIDPRENTE